MGRRVCGSRWDWHHHRGNPQVLDASHHHRGRHSYGGPSSMGSLGRRRDVPVSADAAAAAAATPAISNTENLIVVEPLQGRPKERPVTRTSAEHLPGEQQDQQQAAGGTSPHRPTRKQATTAGPQDEGLSVPADIPAHGTVTAVRTDRPAVPPENEPQGQPEDQRRRTRPGPPARRPPRPQA